MSNYTKSRLLFNLLKKVLTFRIRVSVYSTSLLPMTRISFLGSGFDSVESVSFGFKDLWRALDSYSSVLMKKSSF